MACYGVFTTRVHRMRSATRHGSLQPPVVEVHGNNRIGARHPGELHNQLPDNANPVDRNGIANTGLRASHRMQRDVGERDECGRVIRDRVRQQLRDLEPRHLAGGLRNESRAHVRQRRNDPVTLRESRRVGARRDHAPNPRVARTQGVRSLGQTGGPVVAFQ